MPKADDLEPVPARRRGQTTRAALVRAAIALIPRVGWGSVTTRSVAEQAGVPPGVVHYHFASVDALLIEAATQVSQQLLDETLELLNTGHGGPEPEAGVAALVDAVAGYDPDDPQVLLLTEAALAATRHPDLRQALGEQLAAFRAGLATWLRRQGARRGDASAIATTMVAALDGFVLHRAVDPALPVAQLRAGLRQLVALDRDDPPLES